VLEFDDTEDRPVDVDVVAVLELVGADDRSALLLCDGNRLAVSTDQLEAGEIVMCLSFSSPRDR
jgi:hypothetical protein